MSIFTEKVGMTRRQFLKGSGMLAVAVIVSGVFAKIGFDAFAASDDYIAQRAAGLYSLDEKMALRKSHENPEVIQIYQEFLSPGEQKYLSEKAHHLLHTKYGKDIPAFIEELKGHSDGNSGEAA
jgi:hypothetical protein